MVRPPTPAFPAPYSYPHTELSLFRNFTGFHTALSQKSNQRSLFSFDAIYE
jgi:hypothetical protein